MSSLTATGSRLANSRVLTAGARVGLAARAVVWMLMGVLAIAIAVGGTHRQADQQGALATLAAQSGGSVLLVVLAAGLACYALWRLVEAIFGTRGESSAKDRLASLIRAIMYTVLCFTTVSVLTGSSGSSQDQRQKGLTAQVMQYTGGRWLVGIVGLVVVGVGIYFTQQGVRRDIYGHLDEHKVARKMRPAVTALGVFGNTARGVVIALAGVFVIAAAVTANPHDSTGLDGTLRSLAQESFGPAVLVIAGAGLIAFGLFGVAEGVWSKV